MNYFMDTQNDFQLSGSSVARRLYDVDSTEIKFFDNFFFSSHYEEFTTYMYGLRQAGFDTNTIEDYSSLFYMEIF